MIEHLRYISDELMEHCTILFAFVCWIAGFLSGYLTGKEGNNIDAYEKYMDENDD